MKIIIVDDEEPAIKLLTYMIDKIGGHEVIGQYTNPALALIDLQHLKPDVVFLDVKMPNMDGIEFSSQIREFYPNVQIIFITAYEEYALQAFKVNAIDYLLKPIDIDRLENALQRVVLKTKKNVTQIKPLVRCFGSFEFLRDCKGESIIKVKWRTMITKELFAYLFHHRGKNVRKDMLIDYFWPGSDPKSGSSQLYTSVYNMRKTLEAIDFPIVIHSTDLNYRLEVENIKIDVVDWENELSKIEEITHENYQKVKDILTLYRGAYFSEEGYAWAELEQQRLRMIWLYYVRKISDYLIDLGQLSEAALFHLEVQKIDPLVEESYFMLMKLYYQMGDRISVELQFEELTRMLREEYGIPPSNEVLTWYKSYGYKQYAGE